MPLSTIEYCSFLRGLSPLLLCLPLCLSFACRNEPAAAPPQTYTLTADSIPVYEGRWTPERAGAYYAEKGWQVGANYNPRNAINQLEMWQAETFSPAMIDEELGWAEAIGMNSMRVYLHNLVWEQDSTGYLQRIGRYLDIADRHGISTTFVLFDAVWDPVASLGRQPNPRPHLHNSGWVQSPTGQQLMNGSHYFPKGKSYVQGILRHFRDDARIFAWDLYNEPDNMNNGKFPNEPRRKTDYTYELLNKTFEWARAINPSQPLTTGPWTGELFSNPADDYELGRFNAFQLANSDLISYHNYGDTAYQRRTIERLAPLGRPLLCTEYLARGYDSDIVNVLPLLHENNVSAYNWGLVSGKTQTAYPWASWDSTFTALPEVWHHEIFWPDGRAYDEAETAVFARLGGEE